MSDSSLKVLRRYQYDALDRLTDIGLLASDSTQRFYQENYLVTELGQQTQRTILRHEAQPLAQQQSEAWVTETSLLATDQAHSLLHSLAQTNSRRWAYTAYGHHPAESGLSNLLGFNGECPDAVTGHYLLGRGKRAFNPALMRFNSPDELSPFGEGGVNSYTYCGNDPINFKDPTAHVKVLVVTSPLTTRGTAQTRDYLGPVIMPLTKRSSRVQSTIAGSSDQTNTQQQLPILFLPPEDRPPGMPILKRAITKKQAIQKHYGDHIHRGAHKFDRKMKNASLKVEVDDDLYAKHRQFVEYSAAQNITAGVPVVNVSKVNKSILIAQRRLKRGILDEIKKQGLEIRSTSADSGHS